MPTPPPSSATELWEPVCEHLDSFARAWEQGPTAIERFLPPGPPDLRRLVLVELIKFDIENRLRLNLDRPLEDYLSAFPELAADGPPPDLLYEDYHLRLRAGLCAEPIDYFRRFPNRATELARLLGGTVAPRSTAATALRAPTDVAPGDHLDDFELLALLGEGQFARVFLARQRTMQRLVALKVSHRGGAEAQTLAQLDHPHIVRVYDQRALPDRDLQLVYMTYVPGGTLGAVLDLVRAAPPAEHSGRTLLAAVDAALVRRGAVPPVSSSARRAWAERSWLATVCALGANLADALDYAHRRGVLHRDVKPANVLLTAEGEPLLVDFNVGCCSKLDGAGPEALFGGSLAYMALEHLEAFDPAHPRPPEDVSGHADLFALAVTLWELTTGERPFGPEPMSGYLREVLTALARLRRAGPLPAAVAAFPEGDVPGFRDTLLRCLDPDPARRPATAGELARELSLCLRPAARRLVRPAPGGWREMVARHPLVVVMLLGIIPNGLASLFNIAYNRAEIIAHWPAAEESFERIIPVVNGALFPVGMLLFVLAAGPVGAGLRRRRAGESLPPDDLARRRRRCLRLGRTAALACVACWAAAGVVWPGALRASVGPPPQGEAVYVHFLLSLVVCGLIAAAYPYFLVTFLAVRVFYPALLGPDGPQVSDRAALRGVEQELGHYRAAAAAVPLLAIALLVSRGASDPSAAAALSAAGLLGVGFAYLIEGRTRAHLAALAELAPAEDR
jgi:serine/threonine protein kinase